VESYQEGALRSNISIDWDKTGATIYVRFQDNAGNISEEYSASKPNTTLGPWSFPSSRTRSGIQDLRGLGSGFRIASRLRRDLSGMTNLGRSIFSCFGVPCGAWGFNTKIVRATGRSPLRTYLKKPGDRNGSARLQLESFSDDQPFWGWGGREVPNKQFLRKS
jgi:hypothetical protein